MTNHMKTVRNQRIWDLRTGAEYQPLTVLEIARIYQISKVQVYKILQSRCLHEDGKSDGFHCDTCGKSLDQMS